MPVITSKMQLESLVQDARKAGFLAFDTETTGLSWAEHHMFGCSFCFDGETGWYFGREHFDAFLPVFGKVMGDPLVVKAAHNAKFDLHFLHKAGITVRGPVYDTETLCRLEDENRPNYKLKDLCKTFFGVDAAEEQAALKAYMQERGIESWDAVPIDIMAPYACKDAVLVYRLYTLMYQRIHALDEKAVSVKEGKLESIWSVAKREARITRIAEEMERRGHLVDITFLAEYKKEVEAKAAALVSTIHGIAGEEFNLNSDEQVGDVMLRLGWLPKERTPGGKPKVDKYALEDWDHPFAEAMREYRRFSKLGSTYCDGITSRATPCPELAHRTSEGYHSVGLIHTDYRTNGTVTGRFSCTNPNLQNVDKKSEARKAFIVRPGYTNFYFDYKQIEICGFAYYANDKLMQDALWRGEDFHMLNAVAIFDKPAEAITPDERNKAKTFNFALLYGAGVPKVAKMLKVEVAEAGIFKKRYMDKFPSVNKLKWRCEDAVRQKGYVTNRFGRRRNMTSDTAYKAMNALIQSWAADLLKEALVRVHKALEPYGDKAYILLQIHDELVVEIKDCPEQAEIFEAVSKAMTSVGEMVNTVPIKVEAKCSKTNWYEREDYKPAVPDVKALIKKAKAKRA